MVKGEIFSGEGDAAHFLSLEPYRKFMEENIGIDPFPGTLNLRIDPDEREKFREESASFRMESTEHEGRELGGITIFEARINGRKCCVVEPDLSRHGDNVLEIVAPFNIREKFDLMDGDSLEVYPER